MILVGHGCQKKNLIMNIYACKRAIYTVYMERDSRG